MADFRGQTSNFWAWALFQEMVPKVTELKYQYFGVAQLPTLNGGVLKFVKRENGSQNRNFYKFQYTLDRLDLDKFREDHCVRLTDATGNFETRASVVKVDATTVTVCDYNSTLFGYKKKFKYYANGPRQLKFDEFILQFGLDISLKKKSRKKKNGNNGNNATTTPKPDQTFNMIYAIDLRDRFKDSLKRVYNNENNGSRAIYDNLLYAKNVSKSSKNSKNQNLDFKSPCNPSQREAIKDVMSRYKNPSTGTDWCNVIHGPPGTGKTSTIVELIHQLTLINKTVLVCSLTHKAIDNVMHRVATFQNKFKNDTKISFARCGPREEIADQYNIDKYVLEHKIIEEYFKELKKKLSLEKFEEFKIENQNQNAGKAKPLTEAVKAEIEKKVQKYVNLPSMQSYLRAKAEAKFRQENRPINTVFATLHSFSGTPYLFQGRYWMVLVLD